MEELPFVFRGVKFGDGFPSTEISALQPATDNPLARYFDANRDGNGIWKWWHYFDLYHRHLAKWRDRSPVVVEVGIYSGGSLGMWQDYFGPGCQIIGIDVEPACRSYEREGVRVFIGDQADRAFWRKLRADVPRFDVLIDDGGHLPEQQIVTLEETLPYLSPGGVYICEDAHGTFNPFSAYAMGLARHLNNFDGFVQNEQDCERRTSVPADRFQAAVSSLHLYPYVTVMERGETTVRELVSVKRGNRWQPFMT